MGHYTEFQFDATLIDAPPKVVELLDQVFNNEEYFIKMMGEKLVTSEDKKVMMYSVEDIPPLPIDHEFGKCRRWSALLIGKFDAKTKRIEIESDLKNYDDEIKKFCDWVNPFIRTRKKKLYLGFWKTEDVDHVFNLYKINGEIE